MNKNKYGYYMRKRINDIKILYFTQSGLKIYIKLKYNIM